MRKTIIITCLIISTTIILGCEFKLLPETDENTNDNYGLSFETAIEVPEYFEEEGVPWEYDWLDINACQDDNGVYTAEFQGVKVFKNKKYDIIKVFCSEAEYQYLNDSTDYYFMIDNYYGKIRNTGLSFETAIEVELNEELRTIADFEYSWITNLSCLENNDYKDSKPQLLETFEDKNYHVIEALCNDDTTINYYFIIDNYYEDYENITL